jgi:hypothetical protein
MVSRRLKKTDIVNASMLSMLRLMTSDYPTRKQRSSEKSI